MKTNFWLIVNDKGKVKASRFQPLNTKYNEVVMNLNLELPDELFDQPRLLANITIPKEAAQPNKIDITTIDKCHKAIKHVTGMDMHITVVQDKKTTCPNCKKEFTSDEYQKLCHDCVEV